MGMTVYRWAHVTIICAKIDVDAKQGMMTGAELCWVNTLSSLNKAIATRRDLALDPCVNAETTAKIDGQFMAFAEKVQGYLTSPQHNIQRFIEARGQHHENLDRLPTSGAASSSHNQHEDNTGPTGAHNRA